MAYEFVIARILSGHFGGSIFVWGGLISTVMAGLALGAYLGGKFSDKEFPHKWISRSFFICSALVLGLSFSQVPLIQLFGSAFDVKKAILLSSFSLYFFPSFFMGTISPLLVESLSRLQGQGKAGFFSGQISSLNTAGSIAGTLFTSFVWIPAMKLDQIILIIAILLSLCGFISLKLNHKA